ncbi:MAG: maleylacetoacetate isomerase [Caulobacteraceae bacterium]|nr:maleylacetoacetate isomerase [Caulobacteraceae bacterium]
MRLHDYWRSTASYRVRIALNLKGLKFEQTPHDLRRGEQRAPDYLHLNPQGLVPTLQAGDLTLTQSLAIFEWLEERHPSPPLLPTSPDARAIVRSMCEIIACDIHPLNNLRVLVALRGEFQATEDQVSNWIGQWIASGFAALETLVARHGQGFAFADQPTFADCCLVPQIYSAERFNVPLTPYPRLVAAVAAARALPAVAAAHPDRQPGAD